MKLVTLKFNRKRVEKVIRKIKSISIRKTKSTRRIRSIKRIRRESIMKLMLGN
jgi:hypothetical protein